MITGDVFMMGLAAVSIATGLVTEGVKQLLNLLKVNYNSNIISGIVALLLAAGVGIGYIMLAGIGFTVQSIIALIVLALASWLCAMVGYDKVVQLINQLKNIKKG